jgi:hypothetical protein
MGDRPLHAFLHCWDLYSKLTESRPNDEVKYVDMRHEELVWSTIHMISSAQICTLVALRWT